MPKPLIGRAFDPETGFAKTSFSREGRSVSLGAG
jgi:hypothetical protein